MELERFKAGFSRRSSLASLASFSEDTRRVLVRSLNARVLSKGEEEPFLLEFISTVFIGQIEHEKVQESHRIYKKRPRKKMRGLLEKEYRRNF